MDPRYWLSDLGYWLGKDVNVPGGPAPRWLVLYVVVGVAWIIFAKFVLGWDMGGDPYGGGDWP